MPDNYPDILEPFLMHGEEITCNVSVEPFVTVLGSDVPELPAGTQMPMHIANLVFTDLNDAAYRGQPAPESVMNTTIRYAVDYAQDGAVYRYFGSVHPGEVKGGLLLDMEREINVRLSNARTIMNPAERRDETMTCVQWLDTMLPLLYQQSLHAQNQFLNRFLPQPVPFYNVPHDTAVNDPAIGAKAFYESHHETERCCKTMDEGLADASRFGAMREYLGGIVRQYGMQRVKTVLARTVQQRDYEPFHENNVKHFANVPIHFASKDCEADMTIWYCLKTHAHFVDDALTVFRWMERPAIQRDFSQRLADAAGKAQQANAQRQQPTPARTLGHTL